MDKEIRILLIDDEVDFSKPMAFWFKSKGFSVTVALDGQEGLKVIRETTPDIVFLDIIMPGIDGPTVLKKIREFNKTLPVIMMSAYVEDSRTEKKVDFYGVSGIFYKGDDFSKALAMLESTLKKDKK